MIAAHRQGDVWHRRHAANSVWCCCMNYEIQGLAWQLRKTSRLRVETVGCTSYVSVMVAHNISHLPEQPELLSCWAHSATNALSAVGFCNRD